MPEKIPATKFILKPDIHSKLRALCQHEDRSMQYILEKGVEKQYKALEKKIKKKGEVYEEA